MSSASLSKLGMEGSAGRFGAGYMWVVPEESVEKTQNWFASVGIPYVVHHSLARAQQMAI